jgi:hypothetical protein
MKIANFSQENLVSYFEALGLESSELAQVIREVLKNGFVKNAAIKGLNKQ